MKLFTALFDIVVLPIKVAQDVVCALPDASGGRGVFERTRSQCEQIDQELSR